MVQIAKLIRKKMGEVLIDEGLVKEEQVTEALRRQRSTGEAFADILVDKGFVSEVDIARTLVKQSGLPYIDASRYRINKDGLQTVPAEFMWLHQFIILDKIGKTVLVAISNVLSPEVFEKIEKTSGSQIFVYVSTSSQVRQALTKEVPINQPAAAKPGAKPGAPGAAKPAAPAPAPAAAKPGNPPSGVLPRVNPTAAPVPGASGQTQVRK
jgi:hypothetical protein